MYDMAFDFLRDFFCLTNLENRISNLNEFIPVCILFISLIFCFFGFKIYRVALAMLVSMGVAIAICKYAGSGWNFADKAMAFTMIGTIFSVLVFQFKKLNVYMLSGIICGIFSWFVFPNLPVAIAFWCVGFIIAIFFTEYSLYVLTALFGAVLIGSVYKSTWVFIILTFTGLMFQWWIDRKDFNGDKWRLE